MKRTEKKQIRLSIAARALISALERYHEKNNGDCIVKRELIPHVARRSGWIMEDDYDPTYDSQAIPPPSDRFILANWSTITQLCANQYRKYIVWEPGRSQGIRLGTFEEYQENQKTLALIARGLVDTIEDRASIIVDQGGQSFLITMEVKLLGPGNKDNGAE